MLVVMDHFVTYVLCSTNYVTWFNFVPCQLHTNWILIFIILQIIHIIDNLKGRMSADPSTWVLIIISINRSWRMAAQKAQCTINKIKDSSANNGFSIEYEWCHSSPQQFFSSEILLFRNSSLQKFFSPGISLSRNSSLQKFFSPEILLSRNLI